MTYKYALGHRQRNDVSNIPYITKIAMGVNKPVGRYFAATGTLHRQQNTTEIFLRIRSKVAREYVDKSIWGTHV